MQLTPYRTAKDTIHNIILSFNLLKLKYVQVLVTTVRYGETNYEPKVLIRVPRQPQTLEKNTHI